LNIIVIINNKIIVSLMNINPTSLLIKGRSPLMNQVYTFIFRSK
jgi:hypothetical protein